MSTLGNNLDKINDELEGINYYLDSVVYNLQGKTQDFVDAKMEALSTEVEAKLNKIKDLKIVPPLHAQYENALAQIALLQPLIELSIIDLPSVIEALTKIISIVTAPYQPAIDFVTEIAPKVGELGVNIVKIATYQPPTIQGVDISPFDIDIELTMDDIINA